MSALWRVSVASERRGWVDSGQTVDPIAMAALACRALQSGQAVHVKSFGRRLAYESPRGTNPRCMARGLWGFEELHVVRVTGVVFARLPRILAAAILPAKQGTAPMPRAGQIGDDVWDRRA